jgi:CDGSH-type Zn-finger protein
MTEPSPEQERGPRRVYANNAIEVLWEPKLCIHVRNCVRGLARVFDADRRRGSTSMPPTPRRSPQPSSPVRRGALHFRRLDGGAQEEPLPEIAIEPRPNGPLFVRGRAQIVDEEGRLIRQDTRLALCRCGASANKPFCDGSHRQVGFRTAPTTAESDEGEGETEPPIGEYS